MSDIEVGIQIDPECGVRFFGLEEVNRRIARGKRVIEVRPAGAVMREISGDVADAHVTLAGCKLIIVFENA